MPRFGEGYSGVGMQRGHIVEHDLLGEVVVPNELTDAEKRHMKFSEALAWAKMHQPSSPTNPKAPFANELRIELLDLLKLVTPDEFNKVRFYTAVGSHLDYYHGIDAFFEFDEHPQKNISGGRVTLGVTIRDKGGEELKTDIEIWAPAVGLDETDRKFSRFAKRVARAIVDKMRGGAPAVVDLHLEH